MKLNEHVNVKCFEEKILLCNQDTGALCQITSGAWKLVEDFLDKNENVEQYADRFDADDEIQFVKGFLTNLKDRKYLIDKSEYQRDIKIYWDITDMCNLNCIHCSANACMGKEKKDITPRSLVIAKQVLKINPERIILSGGEPLMHPGLKEIVNYIRGGFDKTLTLMTNGTLITKEMAEFIALHFDSVDVSLDGYDEETCSYIRGKGVFARAIKGIELLQAAGMKKISASMLVTPKTFESIEMFNRLCEKYELHPVIRSLTPSGRAQNHLKELELPPNWDNRSEEAEKEFVKEYIRNKKIPATCSATFSTFQINKDGDIYPCQIMDDKRFLLGNICEIENIEEYVYQRTFVDGQGYKEFSKYLPEHLSGCSKCEANVFCHACPGNAFLKNVSNYTLEDCQRKRKLYRGFFVSCGE